MASHSSSVEDDDVTFHPHHTIRRSPSLHGSPTYDVTSSGPTFDNVCFVTDSHDYNPPTVLHEYALKSRGYVPMQDQVTDGLNVREYSRRVENIAEQKASDNLHVSYATDIDDRHFKPSLTEPSSDSEVYRKNTRCTRTCTSSANLLTG